MYEEGDAHTTRHPNSIDIYLLDASPERCVRNANVCAGVCFIHFEYIHTTQYTANVIYIAQI